MFVIADRVKQNTTTSGYGPIVLGNTFGGFQSFNEAIGDGNSTYYVIENAASFEIGIGTYTLSNNTLSRDVVLSSSNNNNPINLSGLSIVFCTYPATKAFLLNSNGYATSFETSYGGIRFPDNTLQSTAYTNETKRTRTYRSISSNTNITTNDDLILIDAAASQIQITMPFSSAASGYTFTFKKISGNYKCILLPRTGEKIDSQDSFQIFNNNVTLSLFSGGENWYII